MKLKLNNILLFLSLTLLLTACKKPRIDLPVTEQQSNTDHTLTAVHFTDELNGHIVGGTNWLLGIYLSTNDGGKNWSLDTLAPKLLYDLDFNTEGRAYTTGIDGFSYRKDSATAAWLPRPIYHPIFSNGISFFDNENGVAVGGIAYQDGLVITLDESLGIIAIDSFEQELSAVCHSSKNVVHAVGYGLVLRSTDAGLTWEQKDVSGDFFRSVFFTNESIGYMVGYGGSILKTTDAGENWNFLRDASKLLTNKKLFRKIFFVDNDTGYIVGDNGTFWRTTTGGEEWEIVEDMPNVDLYDISVVGNKGFIVGDEGTILTFDR